MVQMNFIREGLQRIVENSASLRTQPDIIAAVDSYEQKELLNALFNLVAGYVSIDSGLKSSAISL